MDSTVNNDGMRAAGLPAAKPATLPECHAVIEVQALQIAQLHEQMGLMNDALAVLQERLKLNSRNSSKPPSSDGPGSGGNRAQRRASERQRGAQKGHKGSFRALLGEDKVDAIVECPAPAVCECGAPVYADGKPLRHQVFDVVPAKARVDEYRLYSGCCTGCGKLQRAALPSGVPSGQIGPRALALVGVLGTKYHLTQHKIRDLLAQLTGVDFSVGAISQAHGKVAAALKAPVTQAATSLNQAAVLHMDETRYPREGSGNWVWAVVQPQLAVYSVLPSRARYVIHNLIGQAPQGVVVSDRYAGYAHLDVARRQVCWAHLLRDFTRIAERSGLPGRIGKRLLTLGRLMFRRRERGWTTPAQVEPLQRRIHLALTSGAQQPHCHRTANTCANLLKLWPALWTFVTVPGVQPTNNAAEQALRGVVLKRKISGPTRSRRGDEFLARGFSAYESCRRQGRDLLDYLHHTVVAWVDNTTPPSLLPAGVPSG
jgi:transposase